jgi:hypothetical protein
VVAALSETAGGGGDPAGGGGGAIGLIIAVFGTVSGITGSGEAGAVAVARGAGAAAVADGAAAAADGVVPVVEEGEEAADGAVRPEDGLGVALAVGAGGRLTAGGAGRGAGIWAGRSGSACSACRSTVTCASTGEAVVIRTALRKSKGRIATIGSGTCCSVQ